MNFRSKTGSKTVWLLLPATYFLTSLSIAIYVTIVAKFHYPVFFADEWTSLGFYVDNGFKDSILCLHNGHPLLIPNFFYRVLLLEFDGAPWARVAAISVVASLNAILLASLVVSGSKHSRTVEWAVFLVAIVAALWLAMEKMLLWGIALHDHMVILGAITAAIGVAKMSADQGDVRLGLFLSILGGLLATLSFGFGVVVWGAIWFGLALSRSRLLTGSILLAAGLAIFVGVMSFVPSCYGGGSAAHGMPSLSIRAVILSLSQVVPAVLGGIFLTAFTVAVKVKTAIPAISIGFVGLALLAWKSVAFWRADNTDSASVDKALVALLTIGWFAVGCTFLIGLGRTNMFSVQELSVAERFAPIPVVFWASLVGIFLRTSFLAQPNKTIVMAFFLALFYLATNYQQAYVSTLARSGLIAEGLKLAIARNEQDLAISSKTLQPGRPQDVLRLVGTVSQRKWDIFNDPVLEAIGKPVADLGRPVVSGCIGDTQLWGKNQTRTSSRILGWARLPDRSPAEFTYLVRDGIVVGVGLRSPVNWRRNRQLQTAPTFERILSKIMPGKARSIFGLHAEWVGAVNIGNDDSIDGLNIYVGDDHGTLCKMGQNRKQ